MEEGEDEALLVVAPVDLLLVVMWCYEQIWLAHSMEW